MAFTLVAYQPFDMECVPARPCHIRISPPKNEKTTQATSGLLFTARRLVKLSGDQGFQAPVAYSVIKNPKY